MIFHRRMQIDFFAVIIWGDYMKRIQKIFLISGISLTAIKFTLIIVAIILVFVFSSRYEHYFYTRPCAQKNTSWVSNDGEISLSINDLGKGTICFNKNGSEISLYYCDVHDYSAHIYDAKVLETKVTSEEDRYEKWKYLNVKNDEFTIVVEKTTFFEVGQEITFYKTRTQRDGSP